jgi:hypothetical protein
MRGDLEHAIGGGVANRPTGVHVLVAELRDDLGAGRVFVAEGAVEAAALAQLVDQLPRKTRLRFRKVTPLEAHRCAGDFPMARL